MILYVLIILVLASFVFTFLGARTWHWGYVLLVEAIFLASVGAFILAAETLRINAVYRAQINKERKRTRRPRPPMSTACETAPKTAPSSAASAPAKRRPRWPKTPTRFASLEDMDHELLIATRRRGRVWRNVTPAGVDPKTGNVKVTITAPTPAGIKGNSVVYLFEEGPPQHAGPKRYPAARSTWASSTSPKPPANNVTLTPTVPLLPTDFESSASPPAKARGPCTKPCRPIATKSTPA